ncbi:methyltransferase family protein [Fluviicoccus keumensis]|uniref:Methyltransferase family protein n=1 Tax=Fluviicoccus keumensis TaxID=1435465 RepID=A0A4Q7ZB02_9GAMM|nr:class I SAM-dependent methyltransferase [Fluviicoccus keumensis]RZU47095.1 methyltransferase family protein [Fluviicoccus keumensis]
MSLYGDYIFPHVLDFATRPFWPQRKEVIAEAWGRVLEIGIGAGANLPHYSRDVTEIVGIEPDAAMLDRARKTAAGLSLAAPLTLAVGDAQALDFPDESFDTVLMCLVLCTIPDPLKALQEARRVLKPGGQVIFLEHVRSPDAAVARWQDRLTPAWKVLGCGCHLNRDTAATFKEAGFRFHRIRRYEHPKMMRLGSAIIQGIALK